MATAPTNPWLARVPQLEGPAYTRIVKALEEGVRRGELSPGDRLPPQRKVAEQLGVDLTTVTRAYSAARSLGLVEGTVGKGTFVRARPEADDDIGLIDLSMNLPPPPEGLSLAALLRDTIAEILQRTDATALMAYHPGFGAPGQRLAGAQWLAPCLGPAPVERMLVAPGAQAALAAILATLCGPGDTIVAEPLTYPGLLNAAARLGLRVEPCPADAEGLIPDALEETLARTGAGVVYAIPTLQNPTTSTAGPDRRRALAKVVEAAGAWLIEDDPYSRLLAAPAPAITTFAPDRCFYIGALSKTLSPGLRIAYVSCPDAAQAERVAATLRATALMPAPLMAAVATSWIREGVAERLLAAVRAEARARRALAQEALPAAWGHPESIHVWLPLGPQVSPDRLRLAAQARGLALVTDEAFAVGGTHQPGVRISLGGPTRRAVLAQALRSLAQVVDGAPAPGGPVV